jgi:hypothetical protein
LSLLFGSVAAALHSAVSTAAAAAALAGLFILYYRAHYQRYNGKQDNDNDDIPDVCA